MAVFPVARLRPLLLAVLAVVVLVHGLARGSDAQLSAGFYSASCPTVQSVVRQVMSQAVMNNMRSRAAILRLFFHGCFVNAAAAAQQQATHCRQLLNLSTLITFQNLLKEKAGDLLNNKDKRQVKDTLCDILELNQVMDRNVSDLSGGELQRFAIAARAMEEADVYMFDEPSCYLDVKQRLKAAQVIRSLLQPKNYVIVVEHDLSILDYLSDYICCLYGTPGAYGVVTLPSSVREGINIFLNGFIPTENLRFREEKLTFRVTESTEEIIEGQTCQWYKYPTMMKTRSGFKLSVTEGSFNDSHIIVMLGENGTGKTTFIRMLAGQVKPDKVGEEELDMPAYTVSYKPQELMSKYSSTVRDLLHKKIPGTYTQAQFRSDVLKPLKIEELMDRQVANLSGGELQRVALCLCLGKPSDIYLIDEPSAHLDSEQRLLAAKVIKRFILHEKKTAFVVEHDFIMATYLADKVVLFEGKPSVDCTANAPESLASGMNRFLSHLGVTFRTDPTTYRPRINKLGSTKDTEQKAAGCYYYLEY